MRASAEPANKIASEDDSGFEQDPELVGLCAGYPEAEWRMTQTGVGAFAANEEDLVLIGWRDGDRQRLAAGAVEFKKAVLGRGNIFETAAETPRGTERI